MGDVPNLRAVEDEALGAVLGERTAKVKNWAEDPRVRDRIRQELVPLLKIVRDRRRSLSDMWESLFKVWTLEHEAPRYAGRSNIYVPAGKKGAETLVAQLVAGTFPGDDYFGVDPRDSYHATRAIDVKNVLKHRIENVAKVRANAERFYRQLVITGNSPVKIYYERRVVTGKARKRKEGLDLGEIGPAEYILHDGPVFQTLDVTNFFVFPENVNDLRDAELVFEDLAIPAATLRKRAREGAYVKSEVEKAVRASYAEGPNRADVSRLSAQGISAVHDANRSGEGW